MQKKNIILLLTFLLVFSLHIFSQQKTTLSGRILDTETGEDLIGATIADVINNIGTATNTYGFYSLSLVKGKHTIAFSYIGYETITKEVDFNSNQKLNIRLSPSKRAIKEVVISAERKDKNITATQMSVEKLEMKQLDKIPVLMGEKDILKTIQLLPGISTVSEGGNGFSVRGGTIDQNLILLDEAPVYSPSHLLGFFSVFNADAIKNLSVYKGGIPANYGGRASSVVDITMKDGNNQKLSASGGIGLLSSRLTIEAPIIKDKMSFIISGRRSYADILFKASGYSEEDFVLYFYDLNAKINYKINDNNKIFVSGYFGKDDFGFDDIFGMSWGNATGTIRWNHLFNSRLFSNTSVLYSNYDYGFDFNGEMSMELGIEDISLKQDYTFFMNPQNTIKYGFSVIHHKFNPGELILENVDNSDILLEEKKSLESGLYLLNEHKLTQKFSANYGLRLSMFNQLGRGWANTYNNKNEVIDSIHYGNNEIMQSYYGLEPRISLNYILNEKSSFKGSYNLMNQYLHLLSNSTAGSPTDTWIPSSTNLKPQTVNQFALGYFRNFLDNSYEFSIESYYKDMQNMTDYKDGTDIMLNENIESYILQGHGRSYGAEFYIKKKYGKLTGWVSYTLGRTEIQIDGINDSQWYPNKIDKTHDVSVVGSYQITKRLSASAAFIYYTGNAVTFPSGKYVYDNKIIPYYTERNGYRMPAYHRLDLSLHFAARETNKFKSSWDFSLYNVYNRHNAYMIYFEESETVAGKTEAQRLSLFGIVPSFTWNFKF